jgi:uncharacterized protein
MTFLSPVMLIGLVGVFAAGVTSGLTGFGFALVTVPLLVLFLPAQVVVPIVTLLSNLTHVVVILETYKWIDAKRIWPLIVASVVATPLGTYLLLVLDAKSMKVLIGVVITLAAVAMLTGFKRVIRNERLACIPVGLASGLLSGSTAMGGPPVVLFFSNQGVDKQVCRANFTLLFTITSLAVIPSQIAGGLIGHDVLLYSLIFSPALLLGTFAGIRLARTISETVFRKLTLVVVIVTGLSAVASGLGLL